MRLAPIFLFASPFLVFGQAVTVGVTGGIPVTDTFDTGPQAIASIEGKTVRYSIGPAVDFRLIGPFRFEVDALYQPFSFRQDGGPTPIDTYTTGNLWQFPMLLKFRIPTPKLKPFVDAGPSVQVATNISQASFNLIQPTVVTTIHPGANAVAGFAVGGGVDFRFGPLTLSPEVRYTRWFDENFSPFPGVTYNGSNLNQVQILLSIRI